MAATFDTCSYPVVSDTIPTTTTTNTYSMSFNIVYIPHRGYTPPPVNVETKKEKMVRIAKERRLASYKTIQQKTPTINHIVRVCKPIHRMFPQRR